jgi:hypothetical protein
MTVFTDGEAKQKLEKVLDKARSEGEVRIVCSDGREFVVRPAPPTDSPLAVPGVDTDITKEEIVDFVRQSRERSSRP